MFCVVPQIILSAPHGFPKIGRVDNVVAVKDGPRFVTTNRHCYALRDSRPNHVSYSRPAEIVEDAPGIPGLTLARFAGMSVNRLVAAVTYKLPHTHGNSIPLCWTENDLTTFALFDAVRIERVFHGLAQPRTPALSKWNQSRMKGRCSIGLQAEKAELLLRSNSSRQLN